MLVERIKGTNIKTIAAVHDEILLEADEHEAFQAAEILKDVMETAGNAILTDVPCVAEVMAAGSWAGANNN
jgi:DNA polymerase I-like protein with 3'-5' exonuclease and polymerase domains